MKLLSKRVISLLLALAIILGTMPMTAFATEESEVNLWSGRSAVFVGDSITAGIGTTKIYYQYLEEALGLGSVTAMGVPGSCVSAASDYSQSNQPLINRYQSIPSADLIVIFMGTNDYGHETPLGSMEDTQDGTFYGALNTIIPDLVAKHTSSKIVFVTPLHRYGFGTSKILETQFTYDNIPNGVGATLGDYVDALKTVCTNNGVSVIDLYTECTLDPSGAEVRAAYMPDGLHPNAAGHEVIAGIMESHIRGYEPVEGEPIVQTELIHGNKFAAGNNQTCRASSRLNYYLKAGTVITLNNPDVMQWACAKTSDENSSSNLGYFPDSGWSDKETAVVAADGWVGFTFKYRDETQSFDLTKPLSDYITIEEPHTHTYENGICTGCGATVSPYLQQLPENIIGCTNLYDSLVPVKGYYTAAKYDTSNGAVLSVVIPVEPGDRIAASSFGPVSENMGSVNGIRVTYLLGNEIVSSLSPGDVYSGYMANGYITVPDGVDAVCVPWWKPSDSNWLTLSQSSKDFAVHSPKPVSAQAPTCTEKGYTAGEICEVCNASLGEREAIPATGHSYSGDTCTICGSVNLLAILDGKYVSILGDSISTFNGYSNNAAANTTIGGNGPRYDAGTADIKPGSYCLLESVDDTWWMHFANRSGMKLLVNNSWAGSQVFGGQTSDGRVIPAAYLDRCVNLHDNTPENNPDNTPINPDVIFVYLGINDYNFNRSKVGTGAVDYGGLVNSDGAYVTPETFGEAYGIMLRKMRNAYPDAQIFAMTLLPENLYSVDKTAWEQHNTYIRGAAEYYSIPVVDLAENCAITWENYSGYMIDKIHPTTAGMKLISDCIETELVAYYKENQPHTHTYKAAVTAPTCTEQGYTTYTCDCGDSYVSDYTDPRPLNILMIGNSFSWDAADFWYDMQTSMTYDAMKSMMADPYDVHLAVMYKGSATLAYHATCAMKNTSAYTYTEIGPETNYQWTPSSGTNATNNILDQLEARDWDIIVIQSYQHEADGTEPRSSYTGGDARFTEPEASVGYLLDYFAEHEPNADVYYYMPWATTKFYGSDTETGYHAMAKYTETTVPNLTGTNSGKSFAGIIPVGTGIQNARTTYFDALRFSSGTGSTALLKDPQNGLQYDSQHLSFGLGRYIAGIIVAETLIPQGMRKDSYVLPTVKDSPAVGELPQEYSVIGQLAAKYALQDPFKLTTLADYDTELADRVCDAIKTADYSVDGIAGEADLQTHVESVVLEKLENMGAAEYSVTIHSFTLENGQIADMEATVTLRVGYTSRSVEIIVTNGMAHPFGEWEIIAVPGAEGPGLNRRVCKICGFVEEVEVDGSWQKFALAEHLQMLPDGFCSGTNLWDLLKPEKLMINHLGEWVSAGSTVYSVTIPVKPGEKIYANSFDQTDAKKGIQVSFIGDYGIVKTTFSSQTYKEFQANGGYLIAPEGAIAVNIPVWNVNADNNTINFLGYDHTYENGICTGCGTEHPNLANYKGKVISILGDSISTFAGYIPVADGFNLQHYARYPQSNLFAEVEHTWWMQVLTALNAKLGINESWRSTEVGNIYDVEVNSGYEGTKACMASTTRIQNLGSNGTPDVILFYGGTNDITQRRTIGTFDPATAPTEVDLTSVKWNTVADAYVAAIMRMQYYYPDAEIIAMLPTFTSKNTDAVIEMYNSVFAAICEHYGVSYIDLRDCGITTANLPDGTHPDETGMDYITAAVLDILLTDCNVESGEHIVHSVTHNLTGAESSLSYYKGVSHGKPFVTTISGDDLIITVTMGGENITASVYADSIVNIPSVTGNVVITAAGREKTIYDDHLQQLPDDICCGMNLWNVLTPENQYYTTSGWGNLSTGQVWSITIPVVAGDRIYANSFEKNGSNGNDYSSTSGIRVAYFDAEGVYKSLSPAEVYSEFTANGYLTIPKEVVAVCVPMWTNTDESVVYVLSADHTYENGICAGCGEKAPHSHSYKPSVTAPTCTEQGYTTYTCACGDSYVTDYVAAKGHTEVVDKAVAATCTATGLTEGKHCSVCKAVLVAQQVVPAKGHTEVIDKAVAATCTATGLTEGKHCSVCKAVLVAQKVVPAKGHTEVIDKAVVATCTATGLTEGKYCSVCKAVLVEQKVIPAKGHTEVIDKAVAATCTATGLTEGKHCSVCKAVLVAQKVVPAKGHTEVIDKAVAATCTATGLTQGKHCSVCGEVLVPQQTIAAKGHSFGAWIVTKPATEDSEGVKERICSACSLKETASIPKLDHEHDYDSVVTNPTCTEQGFTTHICRCGDSYVDTYVNATGHSFGAWVVTTPPTCTSTGTERRDCANCDHYETRTVNALGHTEVLDAAVEPTCTATGLTEGKHCSICNTVLVAQTVIPAKGHTEVIDKAVAPTCTATGLTQGMHCTVCNAVLVAQKVVPATGHTEVIDKAVAPTCTTSGLTAGKHCTVCNKILVEQHAIEATDKHVWDDGRVDDEGNIHYLCATCDTIRSKYLMSISLTKLPNKQSYLEGDTFDQIGLVVTANYDDDTSKIITTYTLDGYSAAVGTKTITITYGNKTATFTVVVHARVPSEITSHTYSVNGETVSKIATGTTVSDFLSKINERQFTKVFKGNAEVSGSALIGTGMVVKIMDGNTVKATYTIIVTGDTNGDGKLTVTDFVQIQAHLLNKTPLQGAAAKAADISGDGKISVTDYVQMQAHILGKSIVQPQSSASGAQKSIDHTNVTEPDKTAETVETVVVTTVVNPVSIEALIPGKKLLMVV